MTRNTVSSYLNWITPSPGDPTFSLLRAHLLFERLLEASLAKSLPHPDAISDARLSFAQKLALARAATTQVSPSHWTWQAVAKLNKIRNQLAHGPGPKLTSDINDYVEFCVKHSQNPLPPLEPSPAEADSAKQTGFGFTAADMVTIALYAVLALRLGFNVDSFLDGSPDRAN